MWMSVLDEILKKEEFTKPREMVCLYQTIMIIIWNKRLRIFKNNYNIGKEKQKQNGKLKEKQEEK